MRSPALLLASTTCLLLAGGLSGCNAPAPEPAPTSTGGSSGPSSGTETPVPGNASPAPTTQPPAGSVGESALPAAADLGRYQLAGTGTGGGTEQLSVCQQNRWESTGATGIVHRTYTGAQPAESAAAVAMSFDSAELAGQAFQTTRAWFADCAATLEGRGGQAQQSTRAKAVPVPDGRAELSEWSWAGGQREAQALIQVGNRVEVVALRSAQPAGALERTLPQLARTLSG